MGRSRAILIALLAAGPAWAQSVEGLVINSITGDPLGKAHVMLRSPAKRYGAVSDAAGKFSVKPIAPGVYAVSAELAGFLMSPGRPGESVKIEVGRESVIGDFRVKMTPHGILTGRVTDANGDPAEHINVQAMRGTRVQSEQSTDANGEFRIAGLPAGRYVVRAQIVSNYNQAPEIRSDGSKEDHYTTSWYPGSEEEGGATLVEARAGQEVSGIDIRLIRAPLIRVSGAITGMPKSPKEAFVAVFDYRYGRSERLSGSKFTLWGLGRGRYQLYAAAGDGAGHSVVSAIEEIEVTSSNLDNLTLAMLPSFEVAGGIGWDGEQARGPAAVRLQPVHSGWEDIVAKIEADGTFRVAGVDPNRYRVTVDGLPEGVYVKSLRLGAIDMPGAILDVRYGAGGQQISVTLSGAGAQISGTVQDGKGPLEGVTVAIRGDDHLWTVRSEDGGGYSRRGFAPGNYEVVVIDPADAESLRRRGSLGMYERDASKVHVTEGEKVVVDLKM